jgi:hypothetical protein
MSQMPEVGAPNTQGALDRITKCFQVKGVPLTTVKVQEQENGIKMFCRATDEKEWMQHAVKLLQIFQGSTLVTFFLGKSYFLKNGELKYGWLLSFKGRNSHEDYLGVLESTFGVSQEQRPAESQVGGVVRKPVKVISSTREIPGKIVDSMKILGTPTMGVNSKGKGAKSLLDDSKN